MKLRALSCLAVLGSQLLCAPLLQAQQSGLPLPTAPLATAPFTTAQITTAPLPRLPAALLDVKAPSVRVAGAPGSMQIIERSCASAPLDAELRRRIVATAAQEWAFFGFQVDDQRGTAPQAGQSSSSQNNNAQNKSAQNNNAPRRFALLDPAEGARVADSVGGYWAAAPGSDWILARQNDAWKSPNGLASRYRDPWSAAFISWVMCESGLGEAGKFQRAIAHHTYIDQAIRARDGKAGEAAYIAYDPGEAPINPGDMLCNGLRPMYRNLAQRRAQLGEGARTHCDIVVLVNESAGQILTIGGNVRSSVRMKIYPAAPRASGNLAPLPTARTIFAHLKLRTDSIEPDALHHSPTLRSMACTMPAAPATFASAKLELPAHDC